MNDALLTLADYEMQTRPDYWQVERAKAADYLRLQYAGGEQVIIGDAIGSCRALEFDTEIFGVSMGRIDWVAAQDLNAPERVAVLQFLLERAEQLGIEQLSFRLSALDVPLIHAAENAGFRLLTVFTGLCKAVPAKSALQSAEVELRPAQEVDLGTLLSITDEAFATGTRFHLDQRLMGKARHLHRRWIENCVNGVVADQVFVAEEQGGVIGYITARSDKLSAETMGKSMGTIDLFAVRRDARGKGVGTALLNAVNQYFADLGIERVDVGTESANNAAINAYVRAGFKVVQSCVTMHHWRSYVQ